MKKTFSILFIVVKFCAIAQNQIQPIDTTLNKLRTTHIKGSKITLQSVIDEKLGEIAIKNSPEHYHLKKVTSGDADSINFETNKGNQVVAVSFFYSPVSAYNNEVDKYKKQVGVAGKEYQFIYNGVNTKITKWEDTDTIFEVVEARTGDKWKLHSTVYDKDLYFRKVKAGIDFSKDEKCVEILKRLGVIL